MSYFFAFLSALLVSFVSSPLTVLLFKKLNILDDPAKHRQAKNQVHQYPVPRGGGIPIFLGLLSSLFFLPLDSHLKGILAAILIALIVGICDDIFQGKIHPLVRLAGNFLSAGVIVFVGIGIPFVNNPLGGIIQLDNPKICLIFWVKAAAFG